MNEPDVQPTSRKPGDPLWQDFTKNYILEQIVFSDKWLRAGLLALYNQQTETEKKAKRSIGNDGKGFTDTDAPVLSSMAEFLQNHGFLSLKQTYIVRRRLLKYAGQLAKIANEKEKERQKSFDERLARGKETL